MKISSYIVFSFLAFTLSACGKYTNPVVVTQANGTGTVETSPITAITPTPTATPDPSATPAPSPTAAPTSTPAPTATPAPTVVPPVPTPTVNPPAPTPTVNPPAPTPTVNPPAPTPTIVPPTPSPSVSPPVPTPTIIPPTPSPTVVPPTPTPTVVPPTPTPTPTVVPPTPSPTVVPPTPTPTVTPPAPTPTIAPPTPSPTVVAPTPTPCPTLVVTSQVNEDNIDAIQITQTEIGSPSPGAGLFETQYCLQNKTKKCVTISGAPGTPLTPSQIQTLTAVGLEDCKGTIDVPVCSKNPWISPSFAYNILIQTTYTIDGITSNIANSIIHVQYRDIGDNSGHSNPPPQNAGLTPAPLATCLGRNGPGPMAPMFSTPDALTCTCFTPVEDGAAFWPSTVVIDAVEFDGAVVKDESTLLFFEGGNAPQMLPALNRYLSSRFGTSLVGTTKAPLPREGLVFVSARYSTHRLNKIWFTYVDGPAKGYSVLWPWAAILGR